MNHMIDRSVDNLPSPAGQAGDRIIQRRKDTSLPFKLTVLLFVFLIIFAEVITMFVGVLSGAIFYAVLVFVLLNLSYFSRSQLHRRVHLAFMLLPLLRLLSLAMPIQQIAPIYQYILTGFPLFLSTLLIVQANGLSSFRLNLSALEWIYQLIIGLSGIPLGLIAGLILAPPPSLITDSNLFSVFILWVVFTLFGAVMEEIIFRGLLQKALFSAFGSFSIILTSLLYASMFIGTLSPGYVIYYGLTGLLFSIWVRLTDSLAGVILAHSLMNIVFLLFVYLFH